MLIVDTSVFVAAANRSEPHHNACAGLLRAEAERLDTTQIATLNHRDFAVVHPAHAENLTLLPYMCAE